MGLSYEVEQFTDPAFFSDKNDGLIRAFQKLAAQGVLRLGGNTSEFGWWKPTEDSPEPEHRRFARSWANLKPVTIPVQRRPCSTWRIS